MSRLFLKTDRFVLISIVIFHWAFAAQQPDYTTLILDVFNHLSTSSVFLLHGNVDSLKDFQKLDDSIRFLSTRGIPVMSLDFKSMDDKVTFYRTRVRRPLFVVNFDSEDEVVVFSNFTDDFQMTYPVWLLIFERGLEPKNMRSKRDENIFHLTFDTEMLVFRTNSKNIEEWYSIRNESRTADFATWDSETGLVLHSRKTLYQRRKDLENSTITVAISDNLTVDIDRVHAVGAMFRRILFELRTFLNFNVETISLIDKFAGGSETKEISSTNVINMLEGGKADVATAEFVMTVPRMNHIDFTHPLVYSFSKLFIKKPDGEIRWNAYSNVFSSGIWTVIGLTILVTGIVLRIASGSTTDGVTHNSYLGHIFLVFGIYCQQGLPDFPTALPLRLAYFSVYISAIVVYAAYSATLTSFLTVSAPVFPFSSAHSFVKDGSYKLILFPDSVDYYALANATDETLIKMFTLTKPIAQLPTTVNEIGKQSKSGTPEINIQPLASPVLARLALSALDPKFEFRMFVAYYVAWNLERVEHHNTSVKINRFGDELFEYIRAVMRSNFGTDVNWHLTRSFYYIIEVCGQKVAFLGQEARESGLTNSLPCKLYGVTLKHGTYYAIVMSKDNPFRGVIDYYIKRLRFGGVVNRFKRLHRPIPDLPDNKFRGVPFAAVTPILIVLSAGVALSVGILFNERTCPSKNSTPSTTNDSKNTVMKANPLDPREITNLQKYTETTRSIIVTHRYQRNKSH